MRIKQHQIKRYVKNKQTVFLIFSVYFSFLSDRVLDNHTVPEDGLEHRKFGKFI